MYVYVSVYIYIRIRINIRADVRISKRAYLYMKTHLHTLVDFIFTKEKAHRYAGGFAALYHAPPSRPTITITIIIPSASVAVLAQRHEVAFAILFQ